MPALITMPPNAISLLTATTLLVMLTFAVGLVMLVARVREMQAKGVRPQSVATAHQLSGRLENVQACDNFRKLFETPVLYYALVAVAIGVGHIPGWLCVGAWAYVALRVVHSLIQCTTNRVLHRLAAFLLGFGLLVVLWLAYLAELVAAN